MQFSIEFVVYSVGGIAALAGGTGLWLHQRFQVLNERIHELERRHHETQRRELLVQRECDGLRFETEWLAVAADPNSTAARYLHVLRKHLSNSTLLLAWILDEHGVVAALDPAVQCPVRLRDLRPSESVRVFDCNTGQSRFAHLPQHVRELTAFRCHAESPSTGLLVVSAYPQIGMDGKPLSRMQALAEKVRFQRPDHPRPIFDSAEIHEIEIAQEMLELRSLLDSEYQTPQEMVEGLLGRLAQLTGYEVASLFLTEPAAQSELNSESRGQTLTRFATGGVPLEARTLQAWLSGEDVFIYELSRNLQSPLVLTPEAILQRDVSVPFRVGLMIPVDVAGERFGVLLLTQRESHLPDSSEGRLIEWASRFLVQTLERECARAELAELARRDALTGLANRRTFDAELARRLEQSSCTREPCSLLLIDLDHFKQINDQHGHLVGDEVLKIAATRLRDLSFDLRVSDQALVARYGGEEFAMILPNVGEEGAFRIAGRICNALHDHFIPTQAGPIAVSASVGVATSHETRLSSEELIARADHALYRAKHTGRNRACREFPHANHPVMEAATR